MQIFASVLTLVALLLAGPASAQTPLSDYYDTTKPFTVKGTLRAATMSPGQAPTMLLVEAPDPVTGEAAQWLIAGKPATQLQRAGVFLIGPNARIKSGDVITVSAYVAKPGSKAAETIAAALQSAAPPGIKAGFVEELQKKDVKVMHGIEIVTPDGKTLAFGDTR